MRRLPNREAGVEAGFRLQRLVEIHRVLVDMADRVAHVEQRQQPGGVPGGARGQFVAFQQHDIGPAGTGKVIGDRGADGTAADDQGFDMGFHWARLRAWLSAHTVPIWRGRSQGQPTEYCENATLLL